MSEWADAVNRWLTVLMQLGASIAAIGMAWNAVHVIGAAGLGEGEAFTSFVQRVIGIVLALMLLLNASRIVATLHPLLTANVAR